MELIHEKDGSPVQIGDEVTDFRGESAVVTGWELPRHEGSTGRIHVERPGSLRRSYFPSVFHCKWRQV